MDNAALLRRQERVLDIVNQIDDMKLVELNEIHLVEQAKKLPAGSREQRIIEQRVADIPKAYAEFKPSSMALGGLIGSVLGGLIGYLVAGAFGSKDRIAGAGLGASLGGAIGSFIGSLWEQENELNWKG